MGAYDGKSDEQVLAIAQHAYRRAESLPPRSRMRQKEFDAFDSAMVELMRRGMMHVLAKIHEMQANGETDIPDPTTAETIVRLIDQNGTTDN